MAYPARVLVNRCFGQIDGQPVASGSANIEETIAEEPEAEAAAEEVCFTIIEPP
jgi:hypothetical protein